MLALALGAVAVDRVDRQSLCPQLAHESLGAPLGPHEHERPLPVAELIDDIGVDTYSDERFYSYRRSVHRKEPDYGRHVHAIALESE